MADVGGSQVNTTWELDAYTEFFRTGIVRAQSWEVGYNLIFPMSSSHCVCAFAYFIRLLGSLTTVVFNEQISLGSVNIVLLLCPRWFEFRNVNATLAIDA